MYKVIEAFIETYSSPAASVLEINSNSLQTLFAGVSSTTYQSTTFNPSTDNKLSFENSTFDIIVISFEKDPLFWMTFREMTRVVKSNGFIFSSAPNAGSADKWRFFSDAGHVLAHWSTIPVYNEPVFPVSLIESFHVLNEEKNDLICVWKRLQEHVINTDISLYTLQGPLEKSLNKKRVLTKTKYM